MDSEGRKQVGSANVFGDLQLDCDVKSDEIIFRHLKATGEVSHGLSEEQPTPIELGGSKYTVTFDPLDGSSIIGTNWSVGSIFGIWKSDEKILIGQKVKEMLISGCCQYGPRTTVILYNQKINTVQEYTLSQNAKKELIWVLTKSKCVIQPSGKIFAPGNLRAAGENAPYREVINKWIDDGYTLRYTGGMVPDIYQLFIKGSGIFTNVISPSHKAKLRVLYEVGPLAHLVEMAGGKANDGVNSLMDLEVTSHDQRSAIIAGSAKEVEWVVETLNKGTN